MEVDLDAGLVTRIPFTNVFYDDESDTELGVVSAVTAGKPFAFTFATAYDAMALAQAAFEAACRMIRAGK